MNARNKTSTIDQSEKMEELYDELTDFLVEKCDLSLSISSLLIRELSPVIGSSLGDISSFLESVKSTWPAAPSRRSKKPGSENPKK
jgi:hypothetical protein